MELQTKVQLPKGLPAISHEQAMMVMGSCFADHIGVRLRDGKFRVEVNPFGTLYNPSSIAAAMVRLMENRPFEREELFEHQGLWHSFMHHGAFSASSAAEALALINGRYTQAAALLPKASWLLLTFGTAFVYRTRDGEGERVVANCHKLPERHFSRRRLAVGEIVEEFSALIAKLRALNPALRLLCTVSPIRHIRDGLLANHLR